MSNKIIADRESVFMELGWRLTKNETQNIKVIIEARSVGALAGTINKNKMTVDMQTAARAVFLKPAILQIHHIIPIRIPKCNPERLMKCRSPVLRKAWYVPLSMSPR